MFGKSFRQLNLRCVDVDCLINLSSEEILGAYLAIPDGRPMKLDDSNTLVWMYRKISFWQHVRSTWALTNLTTIMTDYWHRCCSNLTGNPWVPWSPAIDGVEMTAHPVDLLKQEKVGQLCVREISWSRGKMLNNSSCVALSRAWLGDWSGQIEHGWQMLVKRNQWLAKAEKWTWKRQHKRTPLMQALKMRSNRQSSQLGLQEFPSRFCQVSKVPMVIGTTWDDGATFFDDRSLSLEDFVPLFVEKAGEPAEPLETQGLFFSRSLVDGSGSVERRIVFGHVVFFFFNLFLWQRWRIWSIRNVLLQKDMSEYQEVSDYIWIFTWSSLFLVPAAVQIFAAASGALPHWVLVVNNWTITRSKVCLLNEKSTGDLKSCVYSIYCIHLYTYIHTNIHMYFFDLFIHSPALFSESQDFDVSLAKEVVISQ